MTPSTRQPADLTLHWLICAAMLTFLIVYNIICQVWLIEHRLTLPEADRIVIRSVLYVIAIILFPLTNLVRHIFLRLNQTMPSPKSAPQRYLMTIIVTQSLIEAISLFGPVMFLLGDDFNTLYIFSVLGVAGILLHRPQVNELQTIERALSQNPDHPT